MSVNFPFEYDEVCYDAYRRCLVFLNQGTEVMYSKYNIPYDHAMTIIQESLVRSVIEHLEKVMKSANEISEILDELREKGGKNLIDTKYQLRKLGKFLEDFEKESNILLKKGGELADKST